MDRERDKEKKREKEREKREKKKEREPAYPLTERRTIPINLSKMRS